MFFQRFWPLRRYRLRNGLYMISTRIYANNREGRILTFPRFLIIYTRVRPRVHIYVNSIKLVFGFRFFKIKQNIYFANGTLLLSGYRMVFFKNNKSLMECPPGLLRHGMCVQRSGLIRQTSAETTQNCLLHTARQHHSHILFLHFSRSHRGSLLRRLLRRRGRRPSKYQYYLKSGCRSRPQSPRQQAMLPGHSAALPSRRRLHWWHSLPSLHLAGAALLGRHR